MSLEFLSQEDVLQRIDYILELERRDLDLTDNTLGYHSTSIESLFYLVRYGFLPGISVDEEHLIDKPGDLYYVPRNLRPAWNETEALEDIRQYAQRAAVKHYLLTRFGLDWVDKDGFFAEIASDIVNGNKFADWLLPQIHSTFGISPGPLMKAITRARKRHGVTFSIDMSSLQAHSIRPGDEDLIEMVLECPNGFEYRYFNGLVCQGELERRYIEDLSTYGQFLRS